MDLLVATHNPAKKRELKGGLKTLIDDSVHLVFLDDLKISDEPEETGTTLLENAKLKADYFAKLTGLPTLADDGGIEIDALGGEPGVHSRRWLGYNAPDSALIEYTLERLEEIPFEKRSAHFRIVLYYCNPQSGKSFHETASLDGKIALAPGPNAMQGFPYRALFIVDKFAKYYDELTPLEHNDVNHRLKALSKLIPSIRQDLLK